MSVYVLERLAQQDHETLEVMFLGTSVLYRLARLSSFSSHQFAVHRVPLLLFFSTTFAWQIYVVPSP